MPAHLDVPANVTPVPCYDEIKLIGPEEQLVANKTAGLVRHMRGR